MYTKRIFSPRQLLLWTRNELLVLVILAAAPVFVYEILEQRWLHVPWLPVALVGTAVAFILSFQNNAAYGRAWEARKIWGGIVNSSRAFGFVVRDFVTNEFTDAPLPADELDALRHRTILRHIAWLTALRHALRAPRPWEQGQRERTNREWSQRIHIQEHEVELADDLRPYLSAAEFAQVSGTANPAVQILANQTRELREMRDRNLVNDFRHMRMQGIVEELVAGQGKAERIKNFPYPRQYATLNSTFLWIFLALIPLGLVVEFAQIGADLPRRYAEWRSSFVWASVPFSVIVMWIFHTMERIGRVTENPFEGTVNDVPITTIARGIEIDLRQMLGESPETIPRPIRVHSDTQT